MLLIGLLMLVAGATAQVGVSDEMLRLAEEIDRQAEQDLWPGFDPRDVPLAIFDGKQTILVRHPAPPAEARVVPGHEELRVMEGRHPAIVANSSAEIGGLTTATATTESRSASESAGLLIHEAFHVFQREHHPSWSANEADLFTYPADDPDLLTLRRLESAALVQALTSEESEGRCRAMLALALRDERFAAMPAAASEYERRTELNEGLATWVERMATGRPIAPLLSGETFGPSEIRQRGYASGAALAALLQRYRPDWRAALQADDTLILDLLLRDAIGEHDPGACSFASEERNVIAKTAAADAAALRGERERRRQEFLDQPGFRLVVIAEDAPWFPQGFDPLNVEVVAPGEVLHTRFLKVANGDGLIEVMGRPVLTVAAGAHPMFEGLRRITLTGLRDLPEVVESEKGIMISIEGAEVYVPGGVVRETDRGLEITAALP